MKTASGSIGHLCPLTKIAPYIRVFWLHWLPAIMARLYLPTQGIVRGHNGKVFYFPGQYLVGTFTIHCIEGFVYIRSFVSWANRRAVPFIPTRNRTPYHPFLIVASLRMPNWDSSQHNRYISSPEYSWKTSRQSLESIRLTTLSTSAHKQA